MAGEAADAILPRVQAIVNDLYWVQSKGFAGISKAADETVAA